MIKTVGFPLGGSDGGQSINEIASANPTTAAWSNSGYQINDIGNGAVATDAAAFGQILALRATTGVDGYAKQDATGPIISWTAPDDGNMHRVLVFGVTHVTSAETGGQITADFNVPDGTGDTLGIDSGNHSTNSINVFTVSIFLINPGGTFTIAQNSALTAGSSVSWAEIWGS